VSSLPETDERNTDELWREYKVRGQKSARDALIARYAPLVKYVSGRVAVNLPKTVDEGDLVGYGTLGLIDAIERFDPGRGVKFETYAIARIRGSMIDGLRAMDWVPVSVRHRNRQMETAIKDLENRLGRSATDQEVADELGITMDEYNQRIQDMAGSAILSLEDVWGNPEEGDAPTRMSEVRDERAVDPLDEAEWSSRKDALAECITALPERERLVITLYYFEGLTVKEIAYILKVSPSRVSQLHTKAVLRMRGSLAR
jgi:RNA polymerase sigma factor for flagellar operon FliA